MRKKQFLKSSVALICMAALFLSGCQNQGVDSGTPTANTAAAAQKEEKDGGKDQIELNVAMWDYTSLEYHSRLVKAFEEEYPEVRVNVIEAPAEDYSDKVSVMLSGDNNIDVVFVRDTASYTSMISKEQLAPLDDLINEKSVDLSVYGGMVEQYAIDGKIYGLPYRKDIWMLFYNKDIFDAAGIPYPTERMTLDEYRELAAKLTTGDGNEKIYGALNNKWNHAVSNLAMQTGKYDLLSGDYSFLKPYYDAVCAMQNEDKSSMNYSTIVASNIHYSGPFYNGQVAMMPMGSWFMNNMIENLNNGTTTVQYDVAPIPCETTEGMEGKGVGAITNVSVGSKSKNKDMAWNFVEFVTGQKGAEVLASCGILPAYNSESVLETLVSNEGFPEHGKELLLGTTDVTIEFPLGDTWISISKIIEEEHELIMLGSNSIEEGLNTMAERVQNEVLKNN
ncbi:ABC transporter substrate-binding protein [Hungatella hathewayi]|uniref:ABC transporter substrate-binding protein n=1 Tax=Hungatella hathewayi TaxID=154046 RepID=UPI0035690524